MVPTRQTVNIRHVAHKAGVSLGTVSRVLNDHPSVTDSLRQRVRDAIQELKYRPHAVAQSLRRGTNRMIGVVIPDLRNPFFADLMQNIEISARMLGYSVLFISSDEDATTEVQAIETLASRKVDGVIFLPSNDVHVLPRTVPLPIVVIDRPLDAHYFVGADHRAGARMAADYLVSLGHRRIACISGPADSSVAQARLAGFLDVMTPHFEAAELPMSRYVVHGDFDYVSGREAATTLFRICTPAPTALFACSDQQAIGALRAAADHGIAVPRDLSIVGFDGILVADLVTPRLTTVHQPVAQLADAAITMLLEQATHAQSPISRLFACDLVVRESCAPPADHPC
ncbi:MAG TPA: LacI family DNA-binding transcriptional regulator [Stellaceae bacterium]|nr:LacI family DNA-binding transcriptional regulator [Stellaceae bacterium]